MKIQQMKRVWILMKKPSKQEFKTTSKISSIGLGLVGIIGFLVATVMILIKA